MGLFQKAAETYDHLSHLAGVPVADRPTLLPVSHITQKAQIEVTLDRSGAIIAAREVEKDDCKTIIPATEASASRTSGVAAHPFSDQLEYLLPINSEKHSAYLSALSRWAENPQYSHEKVTAVWKCIKSGKLLDALVSNGLIQLTTEGAFDSGKIAGRDYEKCLVRWRVLNTGDNDAAWKDQSLMRTFIAYYHSLCEQTSRGLCMISGAEDLITSNHPKGITAANYGAKLISSNDSSGFTYRGRFSEPWQAATVGYTASQKAHNALQWIAADKSQSVIQGGRTFLCWNPKGNPVHHVLSPLSIGGAQPPDPTSYGKALRTTLSGMKNVLPEGENVVICAFDAATTGRLSLTYYSELRSSDFYGRIEHWYSTCCWENGPFGVESPALYRIVERAFGTERSKGSFEVDDRVRREQLQRIMTCITECAPIPYEIVSSLFHRASMPQAYSHGSYAALLFTACAVIRKYLNDKSGKEEWKMAFDPQKADRSYQFGCLLAVMEKVERDTYDQEETREPNAMRFQSVFCERPMHTAFQLNKKLEPYFAKLLTMSKGKYFYYKQRIGEIMEQISAFSPEEQNRPLRETYLMGYYLQRKELYTSHKAGNK